MSTVLTQHLIKSSLISGTRAFFRKNCTGYFMRLGQWFYRLMEFKQHAESIILFVVVIDHNLVDNDNK